MCAFIFTKSMVIGVKSCICTYFLHDLNNCEKCQRFYYKQKAKIARTHYRIACIRNDAHHKGTTDIVNRASGIAIETLKVTNMLKNRKLAKALSDSALGGFLSKLKTKSETLEIPVTEAPQFFASSKTCSNCGHKKKELKLT